jgi:hypothetical protein
MARRCTFIALFGPKAREEQSFPSTLERCGEGSKCSWCCA